MPEPLKKDVIEEEDRTARPTVPPFRGPGSTPPSKANFRSALPLGRGGRQTVPPFLPPIRPGGPMPGSRNQPGLVTGFPPAGVPRQPVAPTPAWAAVPIPPFKMPAAAPAASSAPPSVVPQATSAGQAIAPYAPIAVPPATPSTPSPATAFGADPADPAESMGSTRDPGPSFFGLSESDFRAGASEGSTPPSVAAFAAPPEVIRIAPPVALTDPASAGALDDVALSDMPQAAIKSIDAFLSALPDHAPSGGGPASTAAVVPPERDSADFPIPAEYAVDDPAPDAPSEPSPRSLSLGNVDRGRVLASDPFEEPFLTAGGGGLSHEPLEFDDAPQLNQNVTSPDASGPSAAPYIDSSPGTAGPPPDAGRTSENRGVLRLTPIPGIPRVGPPPLDESMGPARKRISRGIPQRVTPIMMRSVTPLSTPVIPRTPVIPATPVRSPTPIGVSSLTPHSIPALVDIANARAAAEALESVAASIRAGHLIVPGAIPTGTEPEVHAAALAAVLAALLGVRH